MLGYQTLSNPLRIILSILAGQWGEPGKAKPFGCPTTPTSEGVSQQVHMHGAISASVSCGHLLTSFGYLRFPSSMFMLCSCSVKDGMDSLIFGSMLESCDCLTCKGYRMMWVVNLQSYQATLFHQAEQYALKDSATPRDANRSLSHAESLHFNADSIQCCPVQCLLAPTPKAGLTPSRT